MKRREWLKMAGAGLALGLGGGGKAMAAAPAAGAAARRPNLLLFYADDLGYGEIGCYGNKEVPTPNVDAIAANGIRFTQGYVSAPLCSPSRAGLMTGRYQTRFGHESNTMAEGGTMPLTETTMAQHLKALGYATCMVGKWHLGDTSEALPFKRGFDEFYGVTGNPGSYFRPNGFIDTRVSTEVREAPGGDFYATDAFAERAAQWIEERKDEAWFLYLPFNAIHTPREAPDKYLRRFEHIASLEQRKLDAMLAAMDDAIGRVMDKVRALGLEENTLVVFISDNGAPSLHGIGNGPLRGYKHTCWEGGFRVPFVMQWKGKLPSGQTYDLPVMQLDMLPTFVTAGGGTVDPAWKLDGVDLLPYLTGTKQGRPHETLFWRINGMWAVRRGDMKLAHGERGSDPPELFDLSKDMGEKNNLAAAMPEKVKELQALFDEWDRGNPTPFSASAGGALPKKTKTGKGKKAEGKAGKVAKQLDEGE